MDGCASWSGRLGAESPSHLHGVSGDQLQGSSHVCNGGAGAEKPVSGDCFAGVFSGVQRRSRSGEERRWETATGFRGADRRCALEWKSRSRIAESCCRGFQGIDCRGLLRGAAEEHERKSRSQGSSEVCSGGAGSGPHIGA